MISVLSARGRERTIESGCRLLIDDCGVAEGKYSGTSRPARVRVGLAGGLARDCPDLWIASRVKKFIKGGSLKWVTVRFSVV